MKISKGQWWGFSIAFLFGGGLLIVLFFGTFFANDPNKVQSPLIGKPAFEFEFTDLNNGKSYQLKDFRGKIVVLNVWASWCLSCRQESRVLQKIFLDYKNQDLIVIGISVKDTTDNAKKFLSSYPKNYPVGLDSPDNKVLLNYGITGVPETFIIDQGGTIIKKFIGAVTEQNINNLLP
ncbi:MAG: TlpA family protein disulfide reductase [SAR324 cluster bacterium]|nr:TlpA family protein disulfide reductase [SAR324 cluster bacterium]